MLRTDYLVIGAGAASMAFVDTLLTEQPSASVIMIDKHEAPGGHWNDAYGFVHLHQPSLLYGISSKQLEGNWAKLLLKGTLPWKHRASKFEILAHYEEIMKQWIASGRVHYFPQCIYDFEKSSDPTHVFHSLDRSQTYNVKVAVKLVNGILGECRVPSTTPPSFTVSDNVNMITPNQVYESAENTCLTFFSRSIKIKNKRYVVLGCGKTAMDTVIFLQRQMNVAAEDIIWVIPNDVWVLRRDGTAGSPWSWGEALLEKNLDPDEAALLLEKKGIFARFDKNVKPTKFRYPVVGDDEMKLIRKVKNVVRRGRVTSIDGSGSVSFDNGEPLQLTTKDHIFVHCTSPGPFNGADAGAPFFNSKEIRLGFLYAPPIPFSHSSLAVLESRRVNKTLDVEFGRKLLSCLSDLKDNSCTDEDVLFRLIESCSFTAKDDTTVDVSLQVQPLKTLAIFLALFDKDPMVGYRWLRSNRLSFFSIPMFKSNVYENIAKLIGKSEPLGLSSSEVQMLTLVASKLEPLKGK